MLRFALHEAARLALNLVGAALMAAAVATLSAQEAWRGIGPFFARFGSQLRALAALDFGTSAVSGQPALSELAARLPETATLLVAGAAVALLIGVPLGVTLGAGPMRRAAAPLMQFVAAAPVFCAALALAFIAEKVLHLQTGIGNAAHATPVTIDPSDPLPALKALALPVLTVGLAGAASMQLLLRNAAGAVADMPWRSGLRRMGLLPGEIDRVYVMPEVISGVLGNLGEFALVLLSAAAVAEWVFDRPGAAVLFVKSIALSDWSMAALILFVFAAVKLAADAIGAILSGALASEVADR